MKGILRTIHRYHFLSSHPSLGYPTVKNRQGLLAFPALTAFPSGTQMGIDECRTVAQLIRAFIPRLQLRGSSGFSPLSLFLFFLFKIYTNIENMGMLELFC